MDPSLPGSFLFNNGLGQFPSDIKAPMCQYSVPNSFYKLNPGLGAQLPAGTPHGISDILSRSMMGAPSAPLLSGYPAMGGFGATMPAPGMYYNRDYSPALGSFAKTPECPMMKGRAGTCWPDTPYECRGGRPPCSNSKFSPDTHTSALTVYDKHTDCFSCSLIHTHAIHDTLNPAVVFP